jgi:hypothetical protein
MKHILFTLILIINTFAFNVTYGGIKNPTKPIFCGKEGHLYDISEPDMWQEIVEKAKDVNETFFYSLMQKALNRAFIVDNNLPICSLLKEEKFEPIYVIKKDFYANGILLYKKGYKVNILEKLNQTMFSEKPLLYFGSLDNNLSKKIGLELIKKYKNAIFVVTKGNIKKLAYKYPYKITKGNNRLFNKFHINCVDTVSILGKKYIYNILIPINKLTKENYNTIMQRIDKYYKEFYK